MKTNLLFAALVLWCQTLPAQDKKGEVLVEDAKIKAWNQAKPADYQSLYHFSNSELESTLLLVVDNDSCYAQIQSGEWGKKEGKDIWVWKFENLRNVRIEGNKFFSDKTDGEFVTFDHENRQLKGLMVCKPWSSWLFYANSRGHELGATCGTVTSHFPGRFPYASWRQLNKAELEKMTQSDRQIMKNEIFARYGYIFKPQGEMDRYFRKQSWYQAQKQQVNDYLTGLEKLNIELIQTIDKNPSQPKK
jgi:hypothetical protein